MNQIITEINKKLATTDKPVARIFYKSGEHKIMLMGFLKGMILEQHKTSVPARLLVMSGLVTYKQGNEPTTLQQYDFFDIPVDVLHEVHAEEDSLCMLIQG
jgi:quercetin dioxygenase-like cupin family protein